MADTKYAEVISLLTENDFLPRSYQNNLNGRESKIDLPSAADSGLGLDGIMIISAAFSGMGLERLKDGLRLSVIENTYN